MRKAILIGLIAFSVSGRSLVAQQQDFSKVEIKVQKVSGSVYMLEGSGETLAPQSAMTALW